MGTTKLIIDPGSVAPGKTWAYAILTTCTTSLVTILMEVSAKRGETVFGHGLPDADH
jgi:hypothetical protein